MLRISQLGMRSSVTLVRDICTGLLRHIAPSALAELPDGTDIKQVSAGIGRARKRPVKDSFVAAPSRSEGGETRTGCSGRLPT